MTAGDRTRRYTAISTLTVGHSPVMAQQPPPDPLAPMPFGPGHDEDEMFSDTSNEEEGEEEVEEDEGGMYDYEPESDEGEFDDEFEQEHPGLSQAGPSEPRKTFLDALISAATQYSSQCRNRHSNLLTPPSQLRTNLPEDPEASSPDDIVEDESDNGSQYSADEAHEPDRGSMNREKLTRAELMKPLYEPRMPFANDPIENPVVLAKLHSGIMCDASIKRGVLAGKPITYVSKTWALTHAWRGFFSEMVLYSEDAYLRPLQGVFVPQIIGYYLADGAISVAMRLPSSSFWVEASEDMSHDLKKKCIAAFDAIHSQGVLHNDVELRHMLISAEGNVSIIDFQESRALQPAPEVGLKQATEADIRLEKRKIKFKLGYEDCRDRELEKRIRVRGRLARIQKRNLRIQRGEAPEAIAPIEPAEPDDILNPIVNNTIWVDCWVGMDIVEPECYIVPGQQEDVIVNSIHNFCRDELDRQEFDAVREASTSGGAPLSGLSRAATGSLPASVQLHTPSPSPPIASNKRKLEEDDETIATPAAKKLQLSREDAVPESEPAQPVVALRAAIPAPVQEPEAELIDELPADEHPDNMTDVLYVPFEGYDGPGGFTIPNIYSTREVAFLRRTWIMQHSVQESQKDGLAFPIGSRLELTSSTKGPEEFILAKGGRKRPKRPTLNRGALKRALKDKMNPGKRQQEALARKTDYFRRRSVPGTGLSDSEDERQAGPSLTTIDEDDVPEGPRIIEWHELPESERNCAALDLDEPSRHLLRQHLKPSAQLHAPKKGILRRQLSPDMREKQLEYGRWLKRHLIEDSDDEEEENSRGTSAHAPLPDFLTRSLHETEDEPLLPVEAATEENLRRLDTLTEDCVEQRFRRSHSQDGSANNGPVAGPSRLRGQPAGSPTPTQGELPRERHMSAKAKGKRRRRGNAPPSDVASVGSYSMTDASDSDSEGMPWARADNVPTPQYTFADPLRGRTRLIPYYLGSNDIPQTPAPEPTNEEWLEMSEVESLICPPERRSMSDWFSAFFEALSKRH